MRSRLFEILHDLENTAYCVDKIRQVISSGWRDVLLLVSSFLSVSNIFLIVILLDSPSSVFRMPSHARIGV